MIPNDDILLRPAFGFAFLKALLLSLLALSFLLLACWLSPYFVLFGITACCGAWYRLLHVRRFSYLIAGGYIRITQGISFKRTGQVEMFRIKDFIITQSFLLQLFRLMDLGLKSTGPENPVIQIRGIKESNLTDMIRDRVQRDRKNNNIYELN